jgi:ATP-binding cassette subfamily B (MDR/TAP) protein 1
MEERAARIVRPALLAGELPTEPVELLFWSGGKDSFLALRALVREGIDVSRLVLLTTFGLPKRVVAHQELPIASIVDQARVLGLGLMGVPLPPGGDYTQVVGEALRWLSVRCGIRSLVFGDLHLEHIRNWREAALGPLALEFGATTRYPLWRASYDELMADFVSSGVVARICAAPSAAAIGPVSLGESFGPGLVARLPAGVDAFGEGGEFHTYVQPASLRPASDLGNR